MGGLVIRGREVEVPGLDIVNNLTGPAWCRLDAGDCQKRPTTWVRQITIHTTKGIWPQPARAKALRVGRDKVVADFWRGDPHHSAAHLAVDSDGSVANLADLAEVMAYHATVVNRWSFGIEMYQEADGSVADPALDATVVLVKALCGHFSIQFQVPDRYTGGPIPRLAHGGGPGVVGVFGHRDVTDNRGRGDPGDEIFKRLVRAGAEAFDFHTSQDVDVWRVRQADLGLPADGIPGPKTAGALEARGYRHGIWAFGTAAVA